MAEISTNISVASKAPTDELGRLLVTPPDLKSRLAVLRVSDLTLAEMDRCWDILEENMQDMYKKSSWGWNPDSKRKELYHEDARFILVTRITADIPEVLAFLTFRFEVEGDEDVAYLYELQICQSCRRQGLGRILMDQLRRIGAHYKMSKIMLTVFNANRPALQFYRALGFELDPTSPGGYDHDSDSDSEDAEDEEEGYDYQILSLSCT
ncbi:acyl-CoA N-acyltransferase [Schizophyllum amplum]|uniref:N-alpha-acetyltransferase 40 n=1 Tax=Schizophyllum amplum TaxID=97359 RepID=A0A550CMY4_9AGAR|nr:acyl-CoA N-acyltransferase [Auriculariopsis ampla]